MVRVKSFGALDSECVTIALDHEGDEGASPALFAELLGNYREVIIDLSGLGALSAEDIQLLKNWISEGVRQEKRVDLVGPKILLEACE